MAKNLREKIKEMSIESQIKIEERAQELIALELTMIGVSNIVLPHPNPPLVRGGDWILLFFVCSLFPNPSLFPKIKIPC